MISGAFSTRSVCRAAAVLLALAVAAPPGGAATAPAKIGQVEGRVLLLRKGEKNPVPAEMGMSVFPGDEVQTIGGKCLLNMTAAGILRMVPNMTVRLPERDEPVGDEISIVRMAIGKVPDNVRRLLEDDVFEVRAPVLVAGTTDSDFTGRKAAAEAALLEPALPPGAEPLPAAPRSSPPGEWPARERPDWEGPPPPPTAPVREGEPSSDAAVPVIPVDCTIDVVHWHPDYPANKWKRTFVVRGDTVSGSGENTLPGSSGDNYRQDPQRWTDEFTGTRRDNVLSGTTRSTYHRTRQECWTAVDANGHGGRCVAEWWGSHSLREEWTFHLGGTGEMRFSGSGTTTWQPSAGCTGIYEKTTRQQYSDEGKALRFTWRIR
jgi:hypothetical protein